MALLFSAVLMIGFTGCSGEDVNKDIDVKGTVGSIIGTEDTTQFPEMIEVQEKNVDNYLVGIDMSKVESYAYQICASGAYPDEVLILKMKSKDDVETAKKCVEDRQSRQTERFTDYNPEEKPKLEQSVIETKGRYVFYAVAKDSAAAKKIFTDAFKS